jgi:hypothetical protein
MAADLHSKAMICTGGDSMRWLLRQVQSLELSPKEEGGIVLAPMFIIGGLSFEDAGNTSFGDSIL